ncbi:MAG: substrate-binding domain-containing protein [Cyanobacteria bacterium SID2]|nr:substrate-binding domain-containing protein [Cyanobacteria bacterium SID2]MBP0004937.1 substrate-binding domain-containing protein [Cyanobacteria bacterium SBC]
MNTTQRFWSSIGVLIASVGLTYTPLPGLNQTIYVVSGTELQEPLTALEDQFERDYPNINLELKFQGSQDIVNNYVDEKNDFDPTVVIPANDEILDKLVDRMSAISNDPVFHNEPRPIVKTMLVGIAWPERGSVLFPNGTFDWNRLESAMEAGNWSGVGGNAEWGSFDFVMTDPTRSNSGQLTMTLWSQSQLGTQPTSANLNQPDIQSLFALVKRSIYQPPRSTDILLQEFIARGPNDADVATVYESIALYRWEQSQTTQGKPYQIYYLDPTIETVSTAAIVTRNVGRGETDAAMKFLDFLAAPEQQAVFVRYGFRPANSNLDLEAVPNSPWTKNIPGTQVDPKSQTTQPPEAQVLREIERLWERAN